MDHSNLISLTPKLIGTKVVCLPPLSQPALPWEPSETLPHDPDRGATEPPGPETLERVQPSPQVSQTLVYNNNPGGRKA